MDMNISVGSFQSGYNSQRRGDPKPGSSVSSVCVQGFKDLSHSLMLSLSCEQGAGLEVELLGLNAASMWNAGSKNRGPQIF